MSGGTIMGQGPECPNCQRQVMSQGMIGGGWRVDGIGGNVLTLTIQTAPRLHGGAVVEITVDRHGRLVEVKQREAWRGGER